MTILPGAMDQTISQVVSGGMGAAAAITVIQISSQQPNTPALRSILRIFATTIPVLVYLWIDPFFATGRHTHTKQVLDALLFVVANLFT